MWFDGLSLLALDPQTCFRITSYIAQLRPEFAEILIHI
jgi:hypothetical protein